MIKEILEKVYKIYGLCKAKAVLSLLYVSFSLGGGQMLTHQI